MKLVTFVAAWNKGGYWSVKICWNSEFAYLGLVSADSMLVCGVYLKLISCPVEGWIRGGRKVASPCGKEKVRCSTWWPMRERAATRAGRVKVVEVKETVMRVKSCLVRRLQRAEEEARRDVRS
jgi:hypothetical protein